MTQPPVTLDEFRRHLNLDPADVADDDELWSTLTAATRKVEMECGAMIPREVTERVSLPYPYVFGDLPLTEWPRFGDAVVTTPAPTGGVWSPLYRYDVTYTVGRDPVPEDLMLATLIVARQLWLTQRSSAAVEFTGMGGQERQVPLGFAIPNRARQLMDSYAFTAIG